MFWTDLLILFNVMSGISAILVTLTSFQTINSAANKVALWWPRSRLIQGNIYNEYGRENMPYNGPQTTTPNKILIINGVLQDLYIMDRKRRAIIQKRGIDEHPISKDELCSLIYCTQPKVDPFGRNCKPTAQKLYIFQYPGLSI